MKKMLAILALAATALFGTFSPANALVDVVEFSTGYFVPDEDSTYDSPYYRWYDEDWGWQHSAIGGTFGTAELFISAWDVDQDYGEVDNIYAYDNGTAVLLGSLNGLTDAWGYTTFTLGSNFFDDIATGLQVWIDIDSTHNYDNWAVTLAKSVLTLDGGTLPDPEPGPEPVPEPSTLLLLGGGLAGLAFARKRFAKK